jgi:predicted nucleotidyltransferase
MFYVDLFRRLEEGGVRYLVVGGIAVNLHGVSRLTHDVDLFLALDQENLRRFVAVAKAYSFKPVVPVEVEDLADAQKVRDWIENKHMLAFGLRPQNPAEPTVDILVKSPIDFEQAYARRVVVDVEGRRIPIAAIADIIAMKSGTGRAKDQDDIAMLRRLGEIGGTRG